VRLLVIASHPDDEILGCGGMIARKIDEGHDVGVLIMSRGVRSRLSSMSDPATDEIEELHKATTAALTSLGVMSFEQFDFPDNRFDSIDLLDITKCLESAIQRFEPDFVFVQHAGDLNLDHAITCRAAMTACRPLPSTRVRGLFTFEVNSSTEWGFGKTGPSFTPDYFVDISDYLEVKFEALKKYQTELRSFPHPRSLEAVKALALLRGSQSGFEAAEAFSSIWRRE